MEINIIPNFLDSALTPVAKEAGERLADIVSLLFTPIVKAKAKRDKNIELFLKQLDTKVNSIPEEKLQAPPLYIVGPALDSVFKFYHEEEHLRQMYASLVASSMQLNNDIHPSYIEIIHQLSPMDAFILQTFLHPLSPNGQHNTLFLCYPIRFLELNINMGYEIIKPNEMSGVLLFLSDDMQAFEVSSNVRSAFDSLKRLGLVNIRKEKVPTYVLEEYGIIVENNDNNHLSVFMVILEMTNYGSKFVKACCDKEESLEFYEDDKCVSKISMNKDGSGFSIQTQKRFH